MTAVGVIGFWTSAACAADLIADGQFYNSNGSGFVDYGAGQSFGDSVSPGAWSVSSGSVDVIGDGFWTAPSSATNSFGQPAGSVDLDGSDPGAISQTISGASAGAYKLSFSLSSNGGSPKTVDVSINGGPATAFTFAGWSGSMTYDAESLTFIGTPTSVSFASGDAGGNQGPVIGNVSFNAVASAAPEPAAWAMMIAGFAAVGAVLRTRRERRPEMLTA